MEGNGNIMNSSWILNNINGIILNGTDNNITSNNIYNNTQNGIYSTGDNWLTGNLLTGNNGSRLVLRADNLSRVMLNILMGNNQGLTIIGDNNDINTFLTFYNILLYNNYALTIQGNHNHLNGTYITGNINGMQLMGIRIS
ncbi:MAG: hypothetical protein BME94_01930 [Methanobacteriales archaeon Met13]